VNEKLIALPHAAHVKVNGERVQNSLMEMARDQAGR
jgi:hypothetical protein